jgi:ketosteroid isomerase-like protein
MSNTETIVRSVYAAFARGDAQAALNLFNSAVKWTEAKSSPYYQGEVEGRSAIVETVLNPIGRDFEAFTITPKEFLTEGNRSVAFGHYGGRVRATGRELYADFVHLWTESDGLLVSFRQYTDGAAWGEAFSAL